MRQTSRAVESFVNGKLQTMCGEHKYSNPKKIAAYMTLNWYVMELHLEMNLVILLIYSHNCCYVFL
jgi:hypothetical protein